MCYLFTFYTFELHDAKVLIKMLRGLHMSDYNSFV